MFKIIIFITNSRGDLFIETLITPNDNDIPNKVAQYMNRTYKDTVHYEYEVEEY